MSLPVMMAPMAGASPAQLAIAVGNAGGMGACGALLMNPDSIAAWVQEVRSKTNGAFQLNTWIPDPAPQRDLDNEAKLCEFLSHWGPFVSPEAANAPLLDFNAQCDAMLAAGPRVISSIMGLYPAQFVKRMKDAGVHWFATVTTVEEALQAQDAGADVLVVQGMEAGGHRGAFQSELAEQNMVGLFSLLPAVVDVARVPVVATGGISDARAIAAALTLGASAVQIGTGLLRSDESDTPAVLADEFARTRPEQTVATRAFSGRLGRSIRSSYTEAAHAKAAPQPAPYPIQRALTAGMRKQALNTSNLETMQAWAGQSAALAQTGPASSIVTNLWDEAAALLPR